MIELNALIAAVVVLLAVIVGFLISTHTRRT